MLAAFSHLLLIVALWFGLGMVASSHAQELPTFAVVAKDGRLFPERIEVPSGQRIKLILKNEGPDPLEFENDEMRIEKVLAAGASSFVVLPKLAPGEYEFIDEFSPVTGVLKIIAR